MSYSRAVQELIDQLGRLPGIGPKSAQRVAFHLLKSPAEDANRLARAIAEAKEKVSYCPRCFNLAEQGGECAVCRDPRRESRLVCVVEDAQDVVAVERTGEFHGRYHVLQGRSVRSTAWGSTNSASRSCWPGWPKRTSRR